MPRKSRSRKNRKGGMWPFSVKSNEYGNSYGNNYGNNYGNSYGNRGSSSGISSSFSRLGDWFTGKKTEPYNTMNNSYPNTNRSGEFNPYGNRSSYNTPMINRNNNEEFRPQINEQFRPQTNEQFRPQNNQEFNPYGGKKRKGKRRRSMYGGSVVPNTSLTNLAYTAAPISNIPTAHAKYVGGRTRRRSRKTKRRSSHRRR